jgi:hypothetical protein
MTWLGPALLPYSPRGTRHSAAFLSVRDCITRGQRKRHRQRISMSYRMVASAN